MTFCTYPFYSFIDLVLIRFFFNGNLYLLYRVTIFSQSRFLGLSLAIQKRQKDSGW